jgi:hypothetical protein
MPRTVTITKELFNFDELSDAAKERARDWYRSCIDETTSAARSTSSRPSAS